VRQRVVFGANGPKVRLNLIGQGPSFTDDMTALPQSAHAGSLPATALE
jgi:hypothetical protein